MFQVVMNLEIKLLNPELPTYRERLKNIEKLSNIPGLASLVVRMDPLLPNVDDTEKNITTILKDISELELKKLLQVILY